MNHFESCPAYVLAAVTCIKVTILDVTVRHGGRVFPLLSTARGLSRYQICVTLIVIHLEQDSRPDDTKPAMHAAGPFGTVVNKRQVEFY